MKIQETCSLKADNVCECDTWFPYGDQVVVKYNVVCGGKLHSGHKFISKTLVIDTSSIREDDFNIKLIITNEAGLTDEINWTFSQLKNDNLKEVGAITR